MKKRGDSLKGKIDPRFYFFLADGSPIKNSLELAEAFEEMSHSVFAHHVSDVHNDFATWIRDVFKDHNLADKLELSKTRHQHQVEILKHMIKVMLK